MNKLNLQSTIRLNHGDKDFPLLGFGVFKVEDGDEVIRAVEEAIVQGYRHIDTAAIYKNEEGVGEGIRRGLARSGLTRDDLFITSKLWNSDQGYESAFEAYEASLQRLGLDKLDLYLVHWPVKGKYVDSWRALEELYRAGKVGAVGVSNFNIHHLEDLKAAGLMTPAVNQIERHPQLRQDELSAYMAKEGIVPIAWGPLMQGQVFDIPELKQLAEETGRSIAQVVLRWHLQTGYTTIPKSIKSERIASNADLYDFELTAEQIARIDALNTETRIGPDPDNFDF